MRVSVRHILLLAAVALPINGAASSFLFRNGTSDYSIVVAHSASVSEKTAAGELQRYIRQISGVSLPLTSNLSKKEKHIIVGYNDIIRQRTGEPKPAADDEAFTYRTSGADILIYGGAERGTMYGVFSFLEEQLGVKWLTKDCTVVPRRKSFIVPDISVTERPAVRYRFDEFKNFCSDIALYAHNKMNMLWEAMPDKYGRIYPYYCVHTSFLFLPPETYFKNHPEYYSLHNGKRISNGQLCLSNPAVLAIVKEFLHRNINEIIGYWCYDVSQNDNELYCECKQCKALEKKYGGHSGIWVWFVNQVARSFPNYNFGTLAYKYTQAPPAGIRPERNVVIRLCSIENCFAHPLEECNRNAKFLKDLKGWKQLTDKLYIWDYVVDFNQYLLPWPNFRVLSNNIKSYIENGAIAIHELGQYQSGDGEFSEMKAWVIAKLLWNPDQNTDSLCHEFINAYYGKAARYVWQYYLLTQDLVTYNTHFDIMTRASDPLYNQEYINKSKDLMEKAVSADDNTVIRSRVDRVRLQTLYLSTMRDRAKAIVNGDYIKTMMLLQKYKPRINESITTDDFIAKDGYI